jgi:GIY-YIG catalytic domain.
MEMTTEQIEKRREYNKNYYINNKDYFKNYYKEYYIQNREHILQKQSLWRQENIKMDTVYMFVNNEGETLYIGSSSRFKERISAHCTSNSNLNMTAEEMVDEFGLEKIIFKNFDEYNLSRHDLFFLEYYFKSNTEEIIKTSEVHYNEEKLTRSKSELIDIATNKVKWEEFNKLDRYLN